MPKYMIKMWNKHDKEVYFQHEPTLTKVNTPQETKKGKQFEHGKKLGKTHQNILIFKKR